MNDLLLSNFCLHCFSDLKLLGLSDENIVNILKTYPKDHKGFSHAFESIDFWDVNFKSKPSNVVCKPLHTRFYKSWNKTKCFRVCCDKIICYGRVFTKHYALQRIQDIIKEHNSNTLAREFVLKLNIKCKPVNNIRQIIFEITEIDFKKICLNYKQTAIIQTFPTVICVFSNDVDVQIFGIRKKKYKTTLNIGDVIQLNSAKESENYIHLNFKMKNYFLTFE